MKAHLTPYFHLAVHFEDQFLQNGPSPGFGTYPYEWNNGTLGCFNLNSHSGREMEGTMMRGWWKTTFIQELVHTLLFIICNDISDCDQAFPVGTAATAVV
jgi:hypothetical protein